MPRNAITVTIQHYADTFNIEDAFSFDNYEVNTQGLMTERESLAEFIGVEEDSMVSSLTFLTHKSEDDYRKIFNSATISFKGEVLPIKEIKS